MFLLTFTVHCVLFLFLCLFTVEEMKPVTEVLPTLHHLPSNQVGKRFTVYLQSPVCFVLLKFN